MDSLEIEDLLGLILAAGCGIDSSRLASRLERHGLLAGGRPTEAGQELINRSMRAYAGAVASCCERYGLSLLDFQILDHVSLRAGVDHASGVFQMRQRGIVGPIDRRISALRTSGFLWRRTYQLRLTRQGKAVIARVSFEMGLAIKQGLDIGEAGQ